MKQNVSLSVYSNKLVRIVLWGIILFTAYGLHAQSLRTYLPVTNGPVTAIAQSGNTLYIGGNFTHVGPNISYGIPVNRTLNVPDLRFAMPNGDVYCALPDGNGGWYIGGTFSAVGGEQRKMLARINEDGSLHSWNPGVEGFSVGTMLIANGKLFIAGSFQIVAGIDRTNLASFDLNTGALTPWNPAASGPYVNSMSMMGNTLYVAGWFSRLGGAERPGGLGAVDAHTGIATAWNPIVNNSIGNFSDFRAIAINDNVVYVGGMFTSLGGQPRLGLAALDATTAQVTAWNPSVSGNVNSLIIDQNFLYVGGEFNSINSDRRDNLASFHLHTGKLHDWKPVVNGGVSSLALNQDKLYIGGYFTQINGVARRYLGVFYTKSGHLLPWSIRVNASVSAIAFNSKFIYIGGEFTSIGGEDRKNLASIDVNTGMVLPWNPSPDNYIYSLLVKDQKLYVGGSFNTISGQSRGRLASFDLRTQQLTSWNPNVTGGNYGDNSDGSISRMVIHSNTLYFIGVFTRVGGVPRRSLAAVDVTTGITTSFYPLTQETDMSDLALANGILYIGGAFQQMSGQTRTGLASFNLSTGQLTSWNPVVNTNDFGNSPVNALTVWNQTVYIGGGFSTVNGESRNGLAAIDGNTGSLTNWNPNAGLFIYSQVFRIATDGKQVYVGALFYPEEGLLSFDVQTGQQTNFLPRISDANGTGENGFVYALLPFGNRFYVGGEFTSVHQQPRSFFAGFDLQTQDAQLLYFKARDFRGPAGPKVVCNWSTAKDQGLDYFIIERSNDNSNFTELDSINATQSFLGLHFYEFTDPHPLPGTSYYRLRMVSFDQTERWSASRQVSIQNPYLIHVYPIPADHKLHIELKGLPETTFDVTLVNQSGQPVWRQTGFYSVKGNNLIHIPVHQLINGNYILRISFGQTVIAKSVIVQH